MINFICEDDNKNKWFEVEGETIGLSSDGVLMDDSGAPFACVDNESKLFIRLTRELLINTGLGQK